MHFHIRLLSGEINYEYANTSFAWTLARCAVLAERDGLLRKPVECACIGACFEQIPGNMFVVKGLVNEQRTNATNAS